MQHLDAFRKNSVLIDKYNEGNAHLIWSMGLYLDESDLERLATDGLTDGGGDRKIDFIIQSNSTLFIVQGYFSEKVDFKIAAPSNKAADLNTAMAWIVAGDEAKSPEKLKAKIIEVRELIEKREIDSIELLYIHNCAESENVRLELETCSKYLEGSYKEQEIDVTYKELGCKNLEKLYIALSQQIVVRDDIQFSGELIKSISGNGWTSHIGFVSGEWLHNLYGRYESDLFSANYRGFMGLSKRKKINNAIKQTAENSAEDFFVYNNGISILTTKLNPDNILEGISIINGAQTTGSIASAQHIDTLKELRVMCKVIVCNDPDKVRKIVQFNNTQNHITTWDHYTNSPEQTVIVAEFEKLGYTYSLKRGFDNTGSVFGIESVAQPLVALHGDYTTANRGKNYVFETKSAYDNAFHDSKAQHILLAFCIAKAIERVKSQLKNKANIIDSEKNQIIFLQNLKSKYFLIAIIGRIIDELVGKPLDPKLVKFTYNTALAKNFTLDHLIDIWCPVIKSILPTVIKHTNGDLYTFLSSENPLEKISSDVKETIATVRSLTKMDALDELSIHIE